MRSRRDRPTRRRGRPTGRRTAGAVCLLVLLALPAGAGAAWSAPQPIATSATGFFAPQPVFTGGGEAIVGLGLDGHFAYARLLGGAWSLRPTTTADPAARLEAYAQSRLLLVSRTDFPAAELLARFGSAAGGFGAARPIAAGRVALRYDVPVNPRGDAAVAFVRSLPGGQRQVDVVVRTHGRPFGAVATIAGRLDPNAVAVALAADGTVLVAFERAGRVETRTRSPRGAWSAAQVLTRAAAAGHTQLSVALGGGSGGAAAVAWFSQALSEGGDNGPAAVRVAARPGGAARFGPYVRLADYAARAPQGAGVEVVANPTGATLVGWTAAAGGHFTADVQALGGPSAVVSDPALDAILGSVAIAPDGGATAVWAPPLDAPAARLMAASRTAAAGAAFSAAEPIGAPVLEIADPAVAASATGGARLVAWRARTAAHTQTLFAATAPAPG